MAAPPATGGSMFAPRQAALMGPLHVHNSPLMPALRLPVPALRLPPELALHNTLLIQSTCLHYPTHYSCIACITQDNAMVSTWRSCRRGQYTGGAHSTLIYWRCPQYHSTLIYKRCPQCSHWLQSPTVQTCLQCKLWGCKQALGSQDL